MRVLISAVGRWKAGPTRDLYEDYRQRLTWPVELKEVEEKRALPDAQLKIREAELLLATLPRDRGGLVLVALDENGQNLGSEPFARRIGKWRDEGRGMIAFLIGGAAGHGGAVLEAAQFKLALGAMTWPHLMVRGMLMEQLYRAQQILAGHPYHRP
ncbi:23S rRNA (pseudouridine(1915)-N(3))-methyltransferase RlmH [Hypericibacter sp.]|uniref:23S rRNA (pseudouridine(1915)-N(3))-methyltransferase RlmH n=1 Tax=Hypericibacter sp. TaxID=2705401 RepID=UPI003D6D9986